MEVRRAIIMPLAILGAIALAAPDALAGTAPAPAAQQTHPSVRPGFGYRHSSFELTFTLAQAPSRGVVDTYYREVVSPPAHARASCSPTQPAPVFSGRQGSVAKITLRPPAHGWCRGRYDVTVFLQRMSVCGPPVEPAPHIVCPVTPGVEPAFPIQEIDTGQALFRVR